MDFSPFIRRFAFTHATKTCTLTTLNAPLNKFNGNDVSIVSTRVWVCLCVAWRSACSKVHSFRSSVLLDRKFCYLIWRRRRHRQQWFTIHLILVSYFMPLRILLFSLFFSLHSLHWFLHVLAKMLEANSCRHYKFCCFSALFSFRTTQVLHSVWLMHYTKLPANILTRFATTTPPTATIRKK